MTRFSELESVTLSRDLDPDETGFVFGAVTARIGGGAPVAATVATGTVYTVPFGVQPMGVHPVEWLNDGVVFMADTVEVVGGHLFTVADVRAGDKEYRDAARFPASLIRSAREYVTDEFEQITGRSFVRRVSEAWELSDGSGFMLTGLRDGCTLKSVAVDGVAALVTDYTIDDNGIVEGPALDLTGRMVVVTVEYGSESVPEDVRRVAGIRARSVLSQASSGVPDRATSIVSPDGGQINLATPGRAGYETGIPEVDAVLSRYTYRIERDVLGML